jgi:hypothetical protein
MNKKIIIGIGISVILILLAISISSPKNNNTTENTNKSDDTGIATASKVEVFLFHATQRCPTCIRIGQLANATVEERFSEQLRAGRIEFREINIDFPENKELAEKFQAGGSALFINAIRNGQDNIKEDTMVWQLAGGDATKFKNYLSDKIKTTLGI